MCLAIGQVFRLAPVGDELYLNGDQSDKDFYLSVFDLKTRADKEEFKFAREEDRYIGTWKNLTTKKELGFEGISYYE